MSAVPEPSAGRCPVSKRRSRRSTRTGSGELLVRGRPLCRGYWGRADTLVDADGWFATGDLASVADDGYVAIEGRRSELIITGGHNVYPAEVEAVLARHPGVDEVAVVGSALGRVGRDRRGLRGRCARPRPSSLTWPKPSWPRSNDPASCAWSTPCPATPWARWCARISAEGPRGWPGACGSVSGCQPSSCCRRWGQTVRRP